MSEQILKIRLGAMSPSVKEQVEEQGFKIDATDSVHLQKDSEAITRLIIRGLITDSQAKQARDKLFKKIQKSLTP